MEKRKLSAIPRDAATENMLEIVGGLGGMNHIVTAQLVENDKILLLNFYEIRTLKKGNREAAFRTFLSEDDYITQDLSVSKVKWLTASFDMMYDFELFSSTWNDKKRCFDHKGVIYIRSHQELELIKSFFKKYLRDGDEFMPWSAIYRFQEKVKAKRLADKYKKETDPIDKLMETVKPVPKRFEEWASESALGFSRYLIYKPLEKGRAECECTHCRENIIVDRKKLRLRNNEKGVCPMCGSKVTIKAHGKMGCRISDSRWIVYVEPREEGFVWRYFRVGRQIDKNDEALNQTKRLEIKDYMYESARCFYTFQNGKPKVDSYEHTEFRQSGKRRWCHDEGKINCGLCILYPENLPQAWSHTPMKYSAMEILSRNLPTVAVRYEWGINKFLELPALEWFSKMGLNNLAKDAINGTFHYQTQQAKGKTIYEVLKLSKENTRILQQIDGGYDELRLLQVAEQINLRIKAEQLRDYYETFGCNTELLKHGKRKVSLHKLVKYITKESENYPIGDQAKCWQYSYMNHKERTDPRIERKQNMAKDWLEYLDWCKALKYDLNNMFFYMPTNFKKIHDRTAKEYQDLQDQKAAAEKKRREKEAAKKMDQTRKAMDAIFKKNVGINAFEIKGKGLAICVPSNGDEIRKEGELLHHCVGSYVEKVASGETKIFFIRKADEPDKPYFTLEWKDNKVSQCRGFRNCGMPAEVKAFVNVFEKKMLEQINQVDKRRCS